MKTKIYSESEWKKRLISILFIFVEKLKTLAICLSLCLLAAKFNNKVLQLTKIFYEKSSNIVYILCFTNWKLSLIFYRAKNFSILFEVYFFLIMFQQRKMWKRLQHKIYTILRTFIPLRKIWLSKMLRTSNPSWYTK